MRYRKIQKYETQVSALGFGCMRLPTTGDDADIDEAQAKDMVRFAIDNGVDYVDTAYGYHGGKSESFLGRALQDGYREKINLATKMPIWAVEKAGDLDRYFHEQLDKLQTRRIDVYLFHCLGKNDWEKLKRFDVVSWIEQQKNSQRIGKIGFSFHDTIDDFKALLNDYQGWDLAQIQYNYMNEDTQAGTEGLLYAHEKGLSVVIMEQVRLLPALSRECRYPEKFRDVQQGSRA